LKTGKKSLLKKKVRLPPDIVVCIAQESIPLHRTEGCQNVASLLEN
jgi:hypothetical protein